MTNQTQAAGECCPRFDPNPWDQRNHTWHQKPFVRDRVTSLFHIPLNFGAVMKRNMAAIEAAGALPEGRIVLSDENSLWGADVYIETAGEVPGVTMATISGRFVSRVFEGPYRNMGKWIGEMENWLVARNEAFDHLYFYYTTCPKCAREYGRNYVVILARLEGKNRPPGL